MKGFSVMKVNNIWKICRAALLLLALVLAGCAGPGTMGIAPTGDTAAAGRIGPAQPGDVAEVNYLCRLKTGEVVAATDAVDETDRKSNIFVAVKKTGPLSIAVVRPDEPAPETLESLPFDAELRQQLARRTVGMKEGEKRRMEVTALMVKPKDEQSGVARMSRVRTRPKEMKMPRSDYEYRARKAPEVGQAFAVDPAFPGRVESFTDNEVVIRFSATPGAVVETPFGSGRIREEGEKYLVDIDAREGSLVRTGNRIGRITKVDDKVITVDYRHPFGYEALNCDVTVSRVTEGKAKKDGAKEK
jgi:FKBP-type peptidyl-prolyl cis-trans isomerase 2